MIGAGIAWSGEQLQRNRIQAATSTREAMALTVGRARRSDNRVAASP